MGVVDQGAAHDHEVQALLVLHVEAGHGHAALVEHPEPEDGRLAGGQRGAGDVEPVAGLRHRQASGQFLRLGPLGRIGRFGRRLRASVDVVVVVADVDRTGGGSNDGTATGHDGHDGGKGRHFGRRPHAGATP